ncbi:MAG: hypothetical protein HZA25_01250, partial [Candidatus Niyogibacteria bacterium]|nr:hypothetical protein [Candidatus Niyogibacteria bacterium]
NTLPDVWSTNGSLLAAVVSALQDIGITFTNGIIQAREFIADQISAKKVVAEVLEMKDSATSDTYCLRINNGEWSKTRSACDGAVSNQIQGATLDTLAVGQTPIQGGALAVESSQLLTASSTSIEIGSATTTESATTTDSAVSVMPTDPLVATTTEPVIVSDVSPIDATTTPTI